MKWVMGFLWGVLERIVDEVGGSDHHRFCRNLAVSKSYLEGVGEFVALAIFSV